ncbi:Por secretion system C-terminal sorting domain-containing protein [Pustulibacterium marinum]|uniref:Aminopeptidase N n=1 Tax=Pustulibacterium marinum TaxID=1224947 RepID=A0A1I7I6N9_9FLAO|nr:M1 family aminopeptidase [Pustulibacterium marinum]SFU68588.1 Por secretion system C-terminal sorting domain-containing protein [Pustulibacterium marinum]
MVKQLLCVALFVTSMVTAQTPEEFKQIVNSEMNRTQSEMEFQQNPNTEGYDLKYHRLEFNLDPAEYYVDGNVTTYFEAEGDLNSITFDFTDQIAVSSVTRNGLDLSFTQNSNDELVVDFPETITSGTLDSLTISYAGTPASDQAAFTASTHNGSPVIYTLSEPYGSKDWWPCKQDLNDKVDSIQVKITTPSQYVSVSNGLETGNVTEGSYKTTTFEHKHPIPAYLIAVAVTNYEVYTHTVGEGDEAFDIVNYIYPETLTTAQIATPVTVDIMELYQDLFEVYPFHDEKYGHAQFGWGGGMEHTTVSFMGGFSRGLIAHELAHQWFGDKVTCGSWRDIWLNEGFATYLAGLVEEHLDGNSDFINWKQTKIANITSNIGGTVYLSESDTTNVNRIFSARLSYNKPAMVLHMLRKKMGDENFYAGLQAYLADPNLAYDYAHTPDIIAHLETQSGLDLTEFFDDWIYGQGYPTYSIDWNQADGANVNLTINQTTSMPTSVGFFEMSLPFRLIGEDGEVLDITLENTSNGQNYAVPVDFTVAQVQFDPEYDIISKNNLVTLKVDNVALLETDLEIFPNPGNASFSIKKPANVSINHIKIYDLTGKLVSEYNAVAEVDVSQLSVGVHKVIIETDLGVVQKSFIKK